MKQTDVSLGVDNLKLVLVPHYSLNLLVGYKIMVDKSPLYSLEKAEKVLDMLSSYVEEKGE